MLPVMFPPGPIAIVRGFIYALLIATAIRPAGDPKAHPQTIRAVWQALWVHWGLAILGGSLGPFIDSYIDFLLFAVLAVIITLLYPVVSYSVVERLGEKDRYPAFIIAMVWINNLRQGLVLGMVYIPFLPKEIFVSQYVLAPIAAWMLWALWRAATLSLGRGGRVGLSMLGLLLVVEVLFTVLLFEIGLR